jgi:hypothetical protein|tara:strand:- start:1241 stop:1471 length:231 start_codon:yes stop_codon:yes gene_type:complete
MANRNLNNIPLPTVTPTNGKRACYCRDTNTYSRKCCDGSYWAQGIGTIVRTEYFIIAENRDELLTEDGNDFMVPEL